MSLEKNVAGANELSDRIERLLSDARNSAETQRKILMGQVKILTTEYYNLTKTPYKSTFVGYDLDESAAE